MANGGVFFWMTKLKSHSGQWTWAAEFYFVEIIFIHF